MLEEKVLYCAQVPDATALSSRQAPRLNPASVWDRQRRDSGLKWSSGFTSQGFPGPRLICFAVRLVLA
jgi:hypothetical protein